MSGVAGGGGGNSKMAVDMYWPFTHMCWWFPNCVDINSFIHSD